MAKIIRMPKRVGAAFFAVSLVKISGAVVKDDCSFFLLYNNCKSARKMLKCIVYTQVKKELHI
ncbi:MAG TPA: hypothetical protein DCQ76_03160 [Ruminococcaceae bacterium]|nr:hypothetical protein [Oscillospiraceae bacterium]